MKRRKIPALPHKFRPYQTEAVNTTVAALQTNPDTWHLEVSPTGTGKCHGIDTPILMFDGSVKAVQDIQVGDILMDPWSQPRVVKSLTTGHGPLYRVIPTKGTSYVVNEHHILSLIRTPESKVHRAEYVNISVKDYLISSNWFKHIHKGWRSPCIKWRHSPVAIPSYILGLWLGDGSSNAPMLVTADRELETEWKAYADSVSANIRIYEKSGCKELHITNGRSHGGHTPNPLTTVLRGYMLINNKHIPDVYKHNHETERLELLAGLIDTDGHKNCNGYDIVQKNKRLAEDIAFVARSLGFAAYITECEKGCQTGAIGTYYRISISGDTDRIPCRLPRKQCTYRKINKNHRVHGITIERIEDGQYFGFELDGNRLYLLGDFTVTHNSLMELRTLSLIEDSILVTPRVEIIGGMLDKIGHDADMSTQAVVDLGVEYGLYTPIRLRNLLAKGELPFQPSAIILDECHHSLADSWQDLHMYLNGVPVAGFTASPFRGTPKGTEEFRKQWGSIHQAITLEEAIARGYCALPSADVWPLIDDDLIEVVNGEIKTSAANTLISSNIEYIVERCKCFWDRTAKLWDRPTMFAVPSSVVATALTKALNDAGLRAVSVTQETKRADRSIAFQRVTSQLVALVQIDVVSEGVDLPIRRLIDIRPTMSPVKWLQQVGRITRPTSKGEPAPEYICLCRNLERHCYLMEGMYPDSTIKKAQEAFTDEDGNTIFSKRSGSRAIGLEGLGKFVTTPIHLLNGVTCFAYNLIHVSGFKRTEYFVLLHPGQTEPLRAVRESIQIGGGDGTPPTYQWGKWALIESTPDLKGCTSANPRPLTPGQMDWWRGVGKHQGRGAEASGLNPHKEVNNRSFQVLPLLKDLRVTL